MDAEERSFVHQQAEMLKKYTHELSRDAFISSHIVLYNEPVDVWFYLVYLMISVLLH